MSIPRQKEIRKDNMPDTKVKCVCGDWLRVSPHSQFPDTLTVYSHRCKAIEIFDKCRYKSTFFNCNPDNCAECQNNYSLSDV